MANSVILIWLGLFFWPVPAWTGEPSGQAAMAIQHPVAGAILPSNMPAPVVLWKTNVPGVGEWSARFRVGQRSWSFEHIQPMWRPPEAEWRQMKQAAQGATLELTVAGYAAGSRDRIQTQGAVRFSLAAEAVQTPLFYREVNLPFVDAVKDPSKIRWRFGSLESGTPPPVVLENMIVCGNCHSFSRKGEYLAMDVDYANNKGSYVITRTAPEMRLATSDIITWQDYRREDGQDTLGLLSQISPDGRYVLSTVKDLSIFMAKPDLAFSQLFFPILGIVGVYDRQTRQFSALPGADDPAWVQSNPTWSPDGQWVVFARSRAVQLKSAQLKGRLLLSREENDDLLRQTEEYRYDLYRVRFNGGKGGQAEPLRGAAANGRSNYFPKYSPDGRWIVFCQASNYMLLQPDSELYLIPAEGGQARRLGCNLGRMNSWHSWSPEGRWLVFASKAHSDYTQLYLSRISEHGEASPPVWLANMVAEGRAANIPEFVDLPAGAIAKIREQFLDDYSYVRAGGAFLRAGEVANAEAKYRSALALNPDNVEAHQVLGLLLEQRDKEQSVEHLQAALRLNPHDPVALYALGCAFASRGEMSNAVARLEESLRWLANDGEAQYRRFEKAFDSKRHMPELLHYKLSLAYGQMGKFSEAERHCREALRLAPDYPEPRQNLGTLLLSSGRLAEAAEQFTGALQLLPGSAQAHNCLGIIRLRQNRQPEALACFQKAVQCNPADWRVRLNLAFSYLSGGQRDQAIRELEEVLRLQPNCEPARQALAKARNAAN